ncbi:MAG: hypothetical protein ACKVT0_18685 [Planctomycetaceae bacterium]
MTINTTNIEAVRATLGEIAGQYPTKSKEQDALLSAAMALEFVHSMNVVEKYRTWLNNMNKPPTALQVLHAKLMGIDIPHELLDKTMLEVEGLMEQIKNTRH